MNAAFYLAVLHGKKSIGSHRTQLDGMIPKSYFHKNWQQWVATWFNQPAQQIHTCKTQTAKALCIWTCPASIKILTVRYQPEWVSRGFSLEELRVVGVHERIAWITVSLYKSTKSLQVHVQELKGCSTQHPRGEVVLRRKPLEEKARVIIKKEF